MPKVFLQNRETGRRYEIVAIDADGGSVTLRGELVEFVEPFDKAAGPVKTFGAYGYDLVQEQADGSA